MERLSIVLNQIMHKFINWVLKFISKQLQHISV